MASPASSASPHFASFADEDSDDLPRTLRREKEARAREARERAAQERASAPSLSSAPEPQRHRAADIDPGFPDMPYPAAVRRFDVPFFALMKFLLKAVIAGIPALILLGAILWAGGELLHTFFPSLIKMKILIAFPN